MNNNKQQSTSSKLHPRSKYKNRYDFNKLIIALPDLESFVSENKYGDLSVDFFNPNAVKALNKALLKSNHDIAYWDIPKDYLCPPIPGRLDYIHYIADLIEDTTKNSSIVGFDIGTGASCIYPILGNQTYGWSFIASDIDKTAVNWAKDIVSKNKMLAKHIDVRLQDNKSRKLKGILRPNEKISFTMCNPPFHASAEDAKKAAQRKLRNLKGKSQKETILNFGGRHDELWCKGGEARFIKDLIFESRHFSNQCEWFTTLVSKASNLKGVYANLNAVNVKDVKTIEMGQGQKTSRIVAWRF